MDCWCANSTYSRHSRWLAETLGSLGAVLHVGLASLGLSAALLAHPKAYDLIRWAGGAYLLWLAWAAWHAPAPSAGTAQIARAQRQPASPAAWAIGAADTEATAPPADIAVL